MFSITAYNLHWMEGIDPTEDLCLHGNAKAIIGHEILEYDDATVSSTALYLLKSLKEDHKIYESNQKKIMMIVKGDILHKVRLNETRHNKKSGSLWDMIKQCVKGSMKRR